MDHARSVSISSRIRPESFTLPESVATVSHLGERLSTFSERRRGSLLVGQRTMELMAVEQPDTKAPKFALYVIRKFKAYGYFIVDHDWQAILICFLISILGFAKVLTTPYVMLVLILYRNPDV